MSSEETGPARPVLRVVKGDPSPEDLAVLTALMAVSGGGEEPAPKERRGGWNDPSRQHRAPLIPGPNAWRAQPF
ncbi:MAG TPA: acyl-CoA carboxylase subunit epsilon [Jatrophihabitans sp.]|uniref:acyl-CoA carboxylase subunit epsilon n=1 Tax=Jatrophihabitans sp. TaxID=1932789 RepID=UPI002E05EC6B|nr:acyl-CoA carboxylase subunit epsilon [Jatrophihabitans sp.]